MTDSKARLIGLLGAIAATALTLATLLPAKWIPRTGLGWEDEHFIIYFATTIGLSLASRRPYVVAIALTMFAGVLEACQGLTPDRIPDFTAALSGAGGVISATTLIILLIRARRSFLKSYPSVRRIRSMIFELAPLEAWGMRLIRGDLPAPPAWVTRSDELLEPSRMVQAKEPIN